jgi:hypothetical protein
MLDSIEEAQSNVPVADLPDEPGQAPQAPVERAQRLAVARGEQRLPNSESGPQSTHLAMEPMQAFRCRIRMLGHRVDLASDFDQDPLDLAGQPGGGRGRRRAQGRHNHSPSVPNAARL